MTSLVFLIGGTEARLGGQHKCELPDRPKRGDDCGPLTGGCRKSHLNSLENAISLSP